MAAQTVKISLELRVGDGPVAGTVCVGDAAPRRFQTWLELLAALDDARNEPYRYHRGASPSETKR